MEEVTPDSGIKNYIVTTRKSGFSDARIKESLIGAGWPQEIIDAALKETASTVLPISETKPETSKKEEQPKKDGLFTEPDILQENKQEIKKEEPKKERKKFSFLAVIALLLSPIPFIGVGVAMAAIENIHKNKLSGMILAILALLINIGVIGFIFFVFYQIYYVYSLNPDQLTGFSKYVVDTFKLV